MVKFFSKDLKKIEKEFEKRNNRHFIKFVYKNYPPKNKYTFPDNIDDLLYEEIKKVGRKALIDYHEYRNAAAIYGFEW